MSDRKQILSSGRTSLLPPNLNDYNNHHSLIYHSTTSHYKSTPNVTLCLDNQAGQRRRSDIHSFKNPNYNLQYPGEFGGSELSLLKPKNSSLSAILDSTSSMMRTATTTLHCLIGSARRASYCGEPDPTIQLSPNGNRGSLYLLPRTANSNDSSLSNGSCEDQRRTVTIYDGRIPTTPTTPAIPFELMAPIDLITQTTDDPVESFVQIILEEPEERPAIITSLSSSRRNSSSRHRHRSSSPQPKSTDRQTTDIESSPVTNLFNSLAIDRQPSTNFEPMDFSFLEPVLRGESAAPPPTRNQK